MDLSGRGRVNASGADWITPNANNTHSPTRLRQDHSFNGGLKSSLKEVVMVTGGGQSPVRGMSSSNRGSSSRGGNRGSSSSNRGSPSRVSARESSGVGSAKGGYRPPPTERSPGRLSSSGVSFHGSLNDSGDHPHMSGTGRGGYDEGGGKRPLISSIPLVQRRLVEPGETLFFDIPLGD